MRPRPLASPEHDQDAQGCRETKGDGNPAQGVDHYVNGVRHADPLFFDCPSYKTKIGRIAFPCLWDPRSPPPGALSACDVHEVDENCDRAERHKHEPSSSSIGLSRYNAYLKDPTIPVRPTSVGASFPTLPSFSYKK